MTAVNWNNPTNSTTYTDVLAELRNRDENLGKMDFSSDTNIVTGFIRWNDTSDVFQKHAGGGVWNNLDFHALVAYLADNETVSGTWTFSAATTFDADMVFTASGALLRSNTSDASDNKSLALSGGGALSVNRGAAIRLNGNEETSRPGDLEYYAGNVSGGEHLFYRGASALTMSINSSGVQCDAGNFIMPTTGGGLVSNTSDASDTKAVVLAGGGAGSTTRGGFIICYGNEHATDAAKIALTAGGAAAAGTRVIDINGNSGEVECRSSSLTFWTTDSTYACTRFGDGAVTPAVDGAFAMGGGPVQVSTTSDTTIGNILCPPDSAMSGKLHFSGKRRGATDAFYARTLNVVITRNGTGAPTLDVTVDNTVSLSSPDLTVTLDVSGNNVRVRAKLTTGTGSHTYQCAYSYFGSCVEDDS